MRALASQCVRRARPRCCAFATSAIGGLNGDYIHSVASEGEGPPSVHYFSSSERGGDGEAATPVSPWHDAPLFSVDHGAPFVNFITEIPRYTTAKMEIDTAARCNPIVQDEKNGAPRHYHGPIFWNYGCLPQTWEDPNVPGDAAVNGALGDNDPLDVVEIGSRALLMGSITAVKPLGCLAMLDDGELDWKLLAIGVDDPLCEQLHDVADVEALCPGVVSGVREWFRWYKTPDGKPPCAFGHGEVALGAEHARAVIAETHEHWTALVEGRADPGKLCIPSHSPLLKQ